MFSTVLALCFLLKNDIVRMPHLSV